MGSEMCIRDSLRPFGDAENLLGRGRSHAALAQVEQSLVEMQSRHPVLELLHGEHTARGLPLIVTEDAVSLVGIAPFAHSPDGDGTSPSGDESMTCAATLSDIGHDDQACAIAADARSACSPALYSRPSLIPLVLRPLRGEATIAAARAPLPPLIASPPPPPVYVPPPDREHDKGEVWEMALGLALSNHSTEVDDPLPQPPMPAPEIVHWHSLLAGEVPPPESTDVSYIGAKKKSKALPKRAATAQTNTDGAGDAGATNPDEGCSAASSSTSAIVVRSSGVRIAPNETPPPAAAMSPVESLGLLQDGVALFEEARLAVPPVLCVASSRRHAYLHLRVRHAIEAEHGSAAAFRARLSQIPKGQRESMVHYFNKRSHWLCHLSASELAAWFSSGGYESPALSAIADRQAAMHERRARIAAMQADLVLLHDGIVAELASASRT